MDFSLKLISRSAIDGSYTIKYHWLHYDDASFRSTFSYLNDVAHNVGCYIMLVNRTIEMKKQSFHKKSTKYSNFFNQGVIHSEEASKMTKQKQKKDTQTKGQTKRKGQPIQDRFHIPLSFQSEKLEKILKSYSEQKVQESNQQPQLQTKSVESSNSNKTTSKKEHDRSINDPTCPSWGKFPKTCDTRKKFLEQVRIFHPDNKNYRRYRLNILEDEVKDMLECRLRAIREKSKSSVVLPLKH
jgi:hypothetical protein